MALDNAGIVIIPAWYPVDTDPASGIFIQQQSEALKAAGLNIAVFFVEERNWPGTGTGVRLAVEGASAVPVFRIRAFTPPKRLKIFRWAWFRQWDTLMQAYKSKYGTLPHLLHAHSFVGGAAARYLSRKYGIPYLITEHYSGFLSGRIPRHWRKTLAGIYGAAAKVIAVSEPLQAAIANYAGEKVAVIPNLVDTGVFYPDLAQEKAKPFLILAVGSLIARKGYDRLLSAFAAIPPSEPIKLCIVGSGPLAPKLKQMLIAYQLTDRVELRETIPPEQLADLMRQSHLLVSASRAESFGMVLAEAMACGLPVISFRVGIAAMIIGEGRGLLVRNEQELKAAILAYLHGDLTVEPATAHRYIAEQFGPDRITGRIREVYRAVLGRDLT